jgi:hypothetical protein
MISALTALFTLTSLPNITEYPDLKAERIAIEALISVPELTPSQAFAVQECARVATKLTAKYSAKDIRTSLSVGASFRTKLLPGFLRIGLTVDKDRLFSGLSVLQDVLTQPAFLEDSFTKDISLGNQFDRAYITQEFNPIQIKADFAKFVWRSLMQPEKIEVSVSGPFSAGKATSAWQSLNENYSTSRVSELPRVKEKSQTIEISEPPIIILESQLIGNRDPLLTQILLGATMLGGGKDCVLWDLCREELRMSYRQEAFIVPVPKGWRLRIAIATDEDFTKPQQLLTLKSRLIEKIVALKNENHEHAKGILSGVFELNLLNFPIQMNTVSPIGDANDRLCWQSFWRLKTGQEWSNKIFLSSFDKLELEKVKLLLIKHINESSVGIR